MEYYAIGDNTYYISHHGIVGMKWGIRRFQPYGVGYKRIGGARGKEVINGSGSHLYGKAFQKKKPKSLDEQRRGSDKSEAVVLGAHIVLDILTLNPVGVAYDVARLAKAGKSAINTNAAMKRMMKSPIDNKTGLRLKTAESSPEKDMARVNPSYGNFDKNTKSNCMLCTTAYDLRRRGYEVTAGEALIGYSADDIKKWYPKAKIQNIVSSPKDPRELVKMNIKAANGLNKANADTAVNEILKQGDGARGNIMVGWGGGGAHSMVYEVSNGKVTIRDCQTNTVYRNPKSILKKTTHIDIARLDNCEFNTKEIKKILKTGETK